MVNSLAFEQPKNNCPKCTGNMAKGFIADCTYGSSDGTIIQNVWVEGEFEKNWIGAAKVKKNHRKFLTTTFRCINCGYLESYATEKK